MASKVQNGSTCDDNDIVITGMSGKFPSSRNIKEFQDNLYNKINMVTDDESRWIHSDPKIPKHSGKISGLAKFDAPFFGIHHMQVSYMDPQNRIIVEESFKALTDAGLNPFSLRGSKMGVYIGACMSETEKIIFAGNKCPYGFGIVGCSRAMFANRISYIYGLEGPSLQCDTACSSSITALNLAFEAMERGDIDSAIVGGANLCLHPNTTLQFSLLGVLSPSGSIRPFDANADGYIRAEAVSCIVLQRKSAAKRIYATLVNTKTNCDGFKQEGITYPSGAMQAKLLNKVYNNFDLNNLGYLEAHGTGTVVGDPEECAAIDKAICSQRKEPLLIGSVKSNCGHAEASSGMCSVVKVLLAFQNNLIPPNINIETIRPNIDALIEGRITVVREATKLVKPYVGINSFGFGGANTHALLKRFDKEKIQKPISDNQIPRLVNWASRSEENCSDFLTNLETQPFDEEYLALIASAQKGGVQGMVFRGFSILQPNGDDLKPTLLFKEVQHSSGVKPPIVWVFSGMGSQWAGMGKSLMSLPIFRKSIQRCHNTLKPSGTDLIKIITTDDPKIFDNVLNSFVGIAAIQIGLVDILRELGITPDYIIGHSVGELGCAYADNCFTAEQMILASYYRGKVSNDMENIKGSMAAIGLGYKEIRPLLPESIVVACHNSSDSSTISGPSEDVERFVNELKAKNIFAKIVPSSNIAYHSKYISHFGPELLKYLKHIAPNKKERSDKWISSSVPKSEWDQEENMYSSAEYHTNNLLNSVLFEEAMENLPKNALTIEISSHGLLQSILKSAMPEGSHLSLTKRDTPNGLVFLLKALGNLYCSGIELDITSLYPKVEWPVSRGTPSLSHLIEFDHSIDHFVYSYKDEQSESIMKKFFLTNESCAYLKGHQIDGRELVPATFYLECVWETFSQMHNIMFYENLSIEFEDVNFLRATTITAKGTIELTVVIHKGTGIFEITESQSVVCTGIIRKTTGRTQPGPTNCDNKASTDFLTKKDFYKELKLRGYHYKGEFQSIEMASADGTYGKIKWLSWVPFLDCMLQLSIVGYDSRSLLLPTSVRLLRIYPEYQKTMLASIPDGLFEVFASKKQKSLVSGGVEIFDVKCSGVQRRRAPADPVLEKYQFLSHFPAPNLSLQDVTRCCIQLVLENQPTSLLSIIELSDKKKSTEVLEGLITAIDELPVITGSFTLAHEENRPTDDESEITGITELYGNELTNIEKSNIVVASHVSGKDLDVMNSISEKLESNGFVILRQPTDFNIDEFVTPPGLVPLAIFPTENEVIVLLQAIANIQETSELKFIHIDSSDLSFKWIAEIKNITDANNLVLVAQNEKFNGILGLINCLRKEPETRKMRCVLIDDADAPPFSPETVLYAKQLKLGLAINVYRKGKWGSYRHLLLKTEYPLTTRSDHVFGNILRIGDLSSLKWLQGPVSKDKFKTKILYSSLNFRDVMLASGRLPIEIFSSSRLEQNCVLGFEYSGIDLTTGKLIMGMTVKGAVASYIEKSSQLCWEVPQTWSLRDAATVPVVYLTVYYAFFYTVDVRKGRSILIHAGSGGIGLAAIRVALAYGLEVFTTVSTAEKKAYLLETFPQLLESHIGNSRDTSFEAMIIDQTDGKGVDFVLNSLSEDKLLASIRCLGKRGKFLEIGKFDMANNNKISLGHFLNELSFHAVLADNLIDADLELVESLKDMVSKDIAKGIVKPLPSTVFMAHQIEQAFRYLMSGKHMGKVMIQIYDDPVSETTMPITVIPQVYFSENLVYVVPGGLGGFGLELIDWMALRGARKIVISSRRGISNSYQQFRINLWKTYDCQVEINTSDISTYDGCLKLIKDSMKLGPVGGIFNLAVILKDALFENQTEELYRQSFAPKALSTLYLDELTRKLCPKLHDFVVFSSVSCGRGNAGQTNYGMANSIMERIIENRIAHGLPGKAIQWGAVGEVGLVAEMAEGKIDLEIGGTLQQRISSCLQVLDSLLTSPDAIVASMVVAEKRASSAGQSPIEFVMNILTIRDIKTISMSSSLNDLGMDSLMAVEIKQVFERDYDIVLTPTDLRSLTFAKLAELSESYKKNDKSKPKINLNESSDDPAKALQLFYGDISCISDPNILFDQINDLTDGMPVIIIPGLDGCSGGYWKKIGAELQSPAFVLQLLLDSTFATTSDIIQHCFKHVSEFLQARKLKRFKIVGYSLGAMIAQMLVPHLEHAGYQGDLLLIEGSHVWIKTTLSLIKTYFKDEDVYRNILASMLSILLPQLSSTEIFNNLRNLPQKELWFQYITETLQQNDFKEIENVCLVMKSVCQKIQILFNEDEYNAISMINAPTLLVRAQVPSFKNFQEDYGLTPYCKDKIEIRVLDGNHQTVLWNEELPKIVNAYFK